MNVILRETAAVLAVSESQEIAADLRETLTESVVESVRHVSESERALDVLVKDEAVGCLVVDESVQNVERFREAVAEIDEALPVVFLATGADREVLSTLSRYDVTRYLPRPVAEETLREVVVESVEGYHRRRVTAEESEMLDALMTEMNIPIFVKDEQGRHLRMTELPGGVNQNVVLGKTDLEVYDYDPAAAEEFYADDMRVIEDGVAIHGKDESSGPAGNEHWARTSKVPWPGADGSKRGLLGVSIDVTDLKQAEKRAARLQDRLEQFASYISHDLQNPLNVASGHVQIARESGDEDALATAADALDRLDEMVKDLDYLARQPPESGLADFVEIPFLVQQVWSFIVTGDADLVLETSDTARIHSSAEELRPMVENLLQNAVTHGGDDVTVRVGTLEDGFFVADDGPGIPPAERERVRQRGYTTSDDGSGTGLAIVSEIVERNGWSMEITESQAGGSRFEFRDALVVPEPGRRRETGPTLELTGSTSVSSGDVRGNAEFDTKTDRVTLTGHGGGESRTRAFYSTGSTTEGPAKIQARLRDVDHVNDYSSAGLLVGDGVGEDAVYGFLGRTTGLGTELVYRPEPGADRSRTLLDDDQSHEWFRIDRSDDTLTCFVSVGGEDWEVVDQRTVAISDPVYLGPAVYTAVPGEACEGTFSDVRAYELQ